MTDSKLQERAINAIRFLSADAIQQANSGHPGMPMGAAAMAYALWTRHLRFNPSNPNWCDRDRFVLSGGHGSMLLYSLHKHHMIINCWCIWIPPVKVWCLIISSDLDGNIICCEGYYSSRILVLDGVTLRGC